MSWLKLVTAICRHFPAADYIKCVDVLPKLAIWCALDASKPLLTSEAFHMYHTDLAGLLEGTESPKALPALASASLSAFVCLHILLGLLLLGFLLRVRSRVLIRNFFCSIMASYQLGSMGRVVAFLKENSDKNIVFCGQSLRNPQISPIISPLMFMKNCLYM